MAVIINEFEIVNPEASAPAQAARGERTKTAAAETPAVMPLTPADIAEIAWHQAERKARLRAH